MTTLDAHKIKGNMNDKLEVDATDEPGPGGAHHEYTIHDDNEGILGVIEFQKGGIEDNGINGITHEALLAIIMHRLACFQAGPFACEENARALRCFENGLHHLNERTVNRMHRGVEGKEVV